MNAFQLEDKYYENQEKAEIFEMNNLTLYSKWLPLHMK